MTCSKYNHPRLNRSAKQRILRLVLLTLTPISGVSFIVGEGSTEAAVADCRGAIRITDQGNPTYAWLYLKNTTRASATIRYERSWDYNGERRKDTKSMTLASGESREAFSFPRRQRPSVRVLECRPG